MAVLLMTLLQQTAANNVDMATARQKAMNFLTSRNTDCSLKATMPQELWFHTEPNSVNSEQVAYYIIGTDQGFVVVAGDDRVRGILAYSDYMLADVDELPAGALFWLDLYRRQIEVLQSQPCLGVPQRHLRSSWYHSTESITPMLNSVWSQTSPFNKQCPLLNGKNTYAGCSAVALAQVMRYWRYPEESGAMPSYVTHTSEISVPALDSIAFDWSNVLDNYPILGGYTSEQQAAVSTLLRYVGQAEHMDYKSQGSDADEHDILDAIRFFGFDKSACYVEKSTILGEEIYPDNIWSAMLWNELKLGRPVIYCAYALEQDSTLTGHAFNVDGYDAQEDTYHVNFGWRGTGDGYYALNAFLLSSYQFNIGQLMFLNVMPPRPQPVLWASKQELQFNCNVGDTVSQRIIVAGTDLIGEVTVTLNDTSGVYGITAMPDVAGNTLITVTFASQESGTFNASLTVSSQDAQDVIIDIMGTATVPEPPHEYELGDVDHNGCVDISDLVYLIDCLLNPAIDACPICADVSPDGVIDISDVVALIDLILTSPKTTQTRSY